jgi:RNA polymerase sigma-70 factor (ECF subfamily)
VTSRVQERLTDAPIGAPSYVVAPTDRDAPSARELIRQADAALVRRCRSGDERAWTELVDRFSSYVYAIATRGYSLTGDRAQDVYQEVFTRIFVQLPQLRDEAALKPWLAQLTRRVCIDRLRAGAHDVPVQAVIDVARVDAMLARIDDAVTVQHALAQLPQPFHEVIERFFVRDESYRTIAEAMGLPPGTVASRISRGLSMLRELV